MSKAYFIIQEFQSNNNCSEAVYVLGHFFTGLLLLAFLSGCSGTHNRTTTGEYTDDASISDEVRAGLLDDPEIKVFQIKVESFKGFVQLTGFVDSAQTSGRATKIAKSVRGVKYVKNSIVLKK
ncbi:MAG: BON domain-containing protein [Desulfamplus sp.]|nr:BON domain-containing protein [Desulfamplus sp.]